jgi:hypothetical protein
VKEPTAEQRALYAEYFPQRTDGGLTYNIKDLLHQMQLFAKHGIDDAKISELWGTPIEFIRSLRAAG